MEEDINILDTFTEVIVNNIDKDDLSNFYRNMSDLTYKRKIINPHFSFFSTTAGIYNSKKNMVSIYQNKKSIIFHELLHVASSKYEDNIRKEGLSINPFGNKIIGTGINEGYTELLASRLFNIDSEVCYGYQYQLLVAQKLEQILGEEYIKRYYFNANLPGLIDDLCLYDSKEKVLEFLNSCDYLINSLNQLSLFFIKKRKIINNLAIVDDFLLNSFIKKEYYLYKDRKITREELLEKIFIFSNSLPDCIYKGESLSTDGDITIDFLNNIFQEEDKKLIEAFKLIRIKEE